MKLDWSSLFAPVVATVLLIGIIQQTAGALRNTGVWTRQARAAARANDPYAHLDRILSDRPAPTPVDPPRDPFAYGAAPRPSPTLRPVPRPVGPDTTRAVRERPRLTSIVFDADPRATVRWNGREYTVREGGLFGDYQVIRITADNVTLSQGGVPFTLTLPTKGD